MSIYDYMENTKIQFPLLYQTSNPNIREKNTDLGFDKDLLCRRMNIDGYFQEPGGLLKYKDELEQLANFIKQLVEDDLPPVLAFYCDFPWIAFQALNTYFKEVLRTDFSFLPNFWAWFVDPNQSASGWSPHRDMGGSKGLFSNGKPKALTCWLPVTDATPLNGCMYIIPKQYDLNYGKDGENGLKIPGLPFIRALPALSGDVFVWDQTVYHWGSKTSEFSDEPRISLALELQSNDAPAFASPLLNPEDLISEKLRLKLIGKQMLQYTHMHKLSASQEELAEKFLAL